MSKSLLILLAVAIVAAVSAVCTNSWMTHRGHSSEPFGHEWLHKELNLSDEQVRALKPIEERFSTQEKELTRRLQDANRDLAKALSEQKAFTPKVSQAVEAVHHHMGELQKASLEHLFEMRQVLTPEQGDKLLKLASQTLEQSP